MEIYQKLQEGIQHQQNHEFLAAEQVYRQILDESPDHPDALHLLGVLAYQIGDYDVAEELIRHAIDTRQDIADYHNNLGEVLRVTGRLDDAREQYQRALALDDTHDNARLNLTRLDQEPQPPAQVIDQSDTLIPVCRASHPSALLSPDDDPGKPNEYLIELSLLAAHKASGQDLLHIGEHFSGEIQGRLNIWPGEPYRLLSALVTIVKPRTVITLGKFNGTVLLSLKCALAANARIICYHSASTPALVDSGLTESDFDQQLQYKAIDLEDPAQAKTEQQQLEQADMIIIEDEGYDAQQSIYFSQLLDSLSFAKAPVVVFDNIRTMPMLRPWRTIPHAKLDISSFGHWTGTGLVLWGDSHDLPD